MRHDEGGPSIVVILNLDLRVSGVSVPWKENGCFAWKVDTFVYTWDSRRILFCDGFGFAVTDTKSKCSIFVRNEHYVVYLFGSRRTNDVLD